MHHKIKKNYSFEFYSNTKKKTIWLKPEHNYTAKHGCLKHNSANDADDDGKTSTKKY